MHYRSMVRGGTICIIGFVYSLLFIGGCTSGPEPLFVMELESELIIPAGLNNLDTHFFIQRNIPTFASNYLTGSVSDEGISEILPNRAELFGQFDAIDWGLVQEVSIWVQSTTDPELKKEVFYQDRINFSGVESLQMFGSLSEVKDMMLSDAINLEIRLRFRRVTPVEITSRLTMNFVANGGQ
ncbi:MAG: hypothetical protein AAFQ02_07020 [Bacteroidota bacterium]